MPVAEPRLRLFCLPHAGGGSSFYRPWRDRLGPSIEVCPVLLPGRESRWRESPHTRMEPLVDALSSELTPLMDRPFAVFGHSMGAAVAYELCRLLTAGGDRLPTRLFVSGRHAPHQAASRGPIHTLRREEFLDRVRELGGTPAEVLADDDLLAALLPGLRADFEVNETYRPSPEPLLDVPVSALCGEADPLVSVVQMLCWRDITRAAFSLRVFSGNHFYLKGGREDLFQVLAEDLGQHLLLN